MQQIISPQIVSPRATCKRIYELHGSSQEKMQMLMKKYWGWGWLSSMKPQASQAHVTSMLCKLTFSKGSRCRVTSNRWDLRSANAKYHYSYLFFYKMYKGDLPLMYSCVFWCEIIDLVVFFGCCCLTPVTLLWREWEEQTITAKKNRLNG